MYILTYMSGRGRYFREEMSLRLKIRRGQDEVGLDRISRLMKKERVHQRILQQCDTMRNQSIMSHNAIILRGQYASTPDFVTKLSRDHEKKRAIQNCGQNRIHFPSLASIRSIKLFSQSEDNIAGITEGFLDSQSPTSKEETYRPVLIKDAKYKRKREKRRTSNLQKDNAHKSSLASTKYDSEFVSNDNCAPS